MRAAGLLIAKNSYDKFWTVSNLTRQHCILVLQTPDGDTFYGDSLSIFGSPWSRNRKVSLPIVFAEFRDVKPSFRVGEVEHALDMQRAVGRFVREMELCG